jgi:large conductance mechanosensitive channel
MDVKGLNAARNFGKEFRDFLLKTNMLALALGVVIGGAVGKVVEAFVADLLMPVIGLIDTKGSWRELTLVVGGAKFTYGHLLGVLVDFLIIASVVFIATKGFVKGSPPAPVKTCPECREGIHPEATRCKFCTAVQPK